MALKDLLNFLPTRKHKIPTEVPMKTAPRQRDPMLADIEKLQSRDRKLKSVFKSPKAAGTKY